MLYACNTGSMYQMDGKLSNLADPTLFVVYESPEGSIIDTVVCDENGQFAVTRELTVQTRVITFYFNDRSEWFSVYPEVGKRAKITGDADYPQLVSAKGGRTNNKLSEFKKKATVLLKRQADVLANMEENMPPNDEEVSRLANINHELKSIVMDFIHKNPTEEASAILISEYLANPDEMEQTDEALKLLSPDLDDYFIVRDLSARTEKAKTTSIGAKAPDFKVSNIYGQTITPDSFANKYFILAFTALWCDMCRTEVMMLDEISAKYSGDSLEILLISLDDEVSEIRETILQDTVKWNLVTDSAGQSINLFEIYNVSSLPKCFLMDKEGVIRLRTSNGLELKRTVDEILN
jgi:peroxiredoxin